MVVLCLLATLELGKQERLLSLLNFLSNTAILLLVPKHALRIGAVEQTAKIDKIRE